MPRPLCPQHWPATWPTKNVYRLQSGKHRCAVAILVVWHGVTIGRGICPLPLDVGSNPFQIGCRIFIVGYQGSPNPNKSCEKLQFKRIISLYYKFLVQKLSQSSHHQVLTKCTTADSLRSIIIMLLKAIFINDQY